MNGIYLINERTSIGGLSRQETISLQKEALLKLIAERNIDIITLNPHQLYPYYTNPHALLFDLQKNGAKIDCLILYSEELILPFSELYYERWLMIRSYFTVLMSVQSDISKNYYIS
ncbi:hypothetical protein CVD28_19545 [Bacillus sp. M6-12]|uniref:hypothetical protein n=1 Tax=Bacillus sp. M6-12 TaxID=2054166 RepID=UPI000C76F07C|nr:hypothetical protein [Bacillus sp. M6-12]PLS15939.1 hypothetical protein CVD28_19545 [Bacillus sp. M6-12]